MNDINIIPVHTFYHSFYRKDQEVELDLGCGQGSFSLFLAQRYPSRQILAVDRLRGRLQRLVEKCIHGQVHNVIPVHADLWTFIAGFCLDSSILRVHLLFPDPWPKKKHARYRIISSEFLSHLIRKLKPGGVLHIATDHLPYWDRIQRLVSLFSYLKPYPAGIDDVRQVQSDFEKILTSQGHQVFRESWQKV